MKKQNGLITWSGQPILFLMFYRPFWPEGALLHHAAHERCYYGVYQAYIITQNKNGQ